MAQSFVSNRKNAEGSVQGALVILIGKPLGGQWQMFNDQEDSG